MGLVEGSCDSRFKEVRDTLEANLDSGEELGASIAIDVDGELVVDMWGGWRDEGRTQPWQEDTIVNVWSTTKTVTSLAALMLVARAADRARIAPVVPPPLLAIDLLSLDMQSPAVKTFTGPPVDANAANTDGWRAADIGGANGHGNARSVARMLSAVSLGGVAGGVQLLSP